MQKRVFFLFIIFIYLPGMLLSAEEAKTGSLSLVIILDASGSMWEQIQGGHKIAVARAVLKDLITSLPDEAEVGLITYGHRAKSDCKDIETLVPLSRVNKVELIGKVETLNPLGKTPITGAIQQAVEMVKNRTEPSTMVLISDGLETCGGDPCQAVREARKAGLQSIVHVIGFDVGKVDVSQLECTAQAGGGLYISAGNAPELASALEKTVETEKIPGSIISVKAVADDELTDVLVRVYRAGTKEEVAGGRTYRSPETNPRLLPVVAGTYDIEVASIALRGKTSSTWKDVVVGENETVEKTADFTTGELSILVTRNGELSDAGVNVYYSGTRERVTGGRTYRSASSNPKVMRITPGEYDVTIGSVEIAGNIEKSLTGVVVEPRSRSEHKIEFDSGTLRIAVMQGETMVDATVTVYQKPDRKQVATGRTYTDPSSNPRVFELPPGEFTVVIQPVKLPGKPSREVEVVVRKGETTDQKADF